MINHFRTFLFNRPAAFFEESLFPVPVDPSFQPSPWNAFTRRIDTALFGESPDASLLDYRFFQFLRLIGGCNLADHLRRYDTRETYRRRDDVPFDETPFVPSIVPAQGLVVTENPDRPPSFLRQRFSVLYQVERHVPLTVFLDGDRLRPARTTPITDRACYVDSLGLTLTASRSGSWVVDYRVRPGRTLAEIVADTLDLPESVFLELFGSIRDEAPEYEEGYRTITDTLTKCCMVLFAQAVANEKRKDAIDVETKRLVSETTGLDAAADGLLYYGWSPSELLRMIDLKRELRCSPPIRNRRRTVEIVAPSLGHLYLCWPVRFGLPARNRLVVDGMLNSAWTVHYANDREEQYVVFRSSHQIRTDTPIRVEIP